MILFLDNIGKMEVCSGCYAVLLILDAWCAMAIDRFDCGHISKGQGIGPRSKYWMLFVCFR